MKKNKITVCVVDADNKKVLDQIDKKVPNIFNIFDVCDLCFESQNGECRDCIVNMLQMDQYTL